MKFVKLILLFITFAFCGCTSDDKSEEKDEPNTMNTPEIVFTLNVNTETTNSDNWIIVHNDRGELIDFKTYENGDVLEIEAVSTLVTDKITITDYINTIENGNDRYNFVTFTEISKGSIWNFKPFEELQNNEEVRGEETGSFDVTISNVPLSANCNISHGFGSVGGSGSSIGSTITKSVSLYENVSEYLITFTETSGISKQLLIGPGIDGTNINFDYSQFKNFDSYVDVNFQQNVPYFSSVFAFYLNREFSNGGGFHLNLTFPFDSSLPIRLGYLNRFDKYFTQLNFNDSNYYYSYKNYGEKPEEINVPENINLSISNSSIKDFEFSTPLSFNRINSTWQVSEGTINEDLIQTNWTIIAENAEKHLIGDIPDELLARYPKINLDDLTYSSTSLFLNFDTYDEFIEKRFRSNELNSFFTSEETITFFN